MKWIGQHIYDLASRFRNEVYLEAISASTETDMLVVDSAGKITKRAIDAITVDVSDFLTDGADNRVVTATGTDALLAETYLTFQNTGNVSTLSILSDQDTGDLFSIATTTHGATTLTTTDDDATAAHFEIAANGNITLDSAANIYLQAAGNTMDLDADYFSFTSASNGFPSLNLRSTIAGALGAKLQFTKDRYSSAGVDGDDIGTILFNAGDAAQTQTDFAQIRAEISEADNTDEAGKLTFSVAESDGTTTALTAGLVIEGEHATDGQVDVTIAAGAASTTTVAGTLTMGSTAAMTNAGLLSVAAQTNITSLGTLTGLTVGGDLTVNGENTLFESGTIDKPLLTVKNTNTGRLSSGELKFLKDAADVVDGEQIGLVSFYGDNDAGTPEVIQYAQIVSEVSDMTDGQEAGDMYLKVASYDGVLTNGLYLDGDTNADGEVDVTIAAGAASTTTIAGDLAVTSDATISGGNLLVTSGTAGDCVVVISADTDNNYENDSPKLWFKADGDIIEGAIQHKDNTFDFISNVSSNGGFRFLTGTTNNTGTTDPENGATERMSIADDGVITLANLVCTAAATFGGGYGSTGATISTAGVGTFNGALTTDGAFTCASRTLAVSSSTDGDHDGDVVYFGGTTSMTIGKIYHYKSDGTWEIVNADSTTTSAGLLAVALGAASDTNGMLLRGMVTLDHDPGAIGDILYVQSDNAGTPGNATATAPSASGDCVRIIGYQVSHASNGNIWFNPDSTFVQVA